MFDAIADFSAEIYDGKKICVMPIPRFRLSAASCNVLGCNFYPSDTLDLEALRIVSDPQHELAEIDRKGYADLEWGKSAMTRILSISTHRAFSKAQA
jgi:hypothetical protein